jgi:GNAT superfamily N-acetyltransferase
VQQQRGDGLTLTSDPTRLDLPQVHRWLSEQAYWALGRSWDVFERTVAGSRTYGVLDGDEQVAFARAVTDGATFAWVCDVFVAAEHRGRGIGSWLVRAVVADLSGLGVERFLLATQDAHEVYRGLGFTELAEPGRWMELDLRSTAPRPAR